MGISNERWSQLTTNEKIDILKILITGVIDSLNAILKSKGYPSILNAFEKE